MQSSAATGKCKLRDAIKDYYRRVILTPDLRGQPPSTVMYALKTSCTVLSRPAAYPPGICTVARAAKSEALAEIRRQTPGWPGAPAPAYLDLNEKLELTTLKTRDER